MTPLRISALAILLTLALPWPSRAADEAQPVLAWERSGPGGTLPRIEAADARLALLAGKQFGLCARLRLPVDGAILARQTPDRKSGWRLFVKDAALHFEAAFDWKNARNNRPLELSVPLAAIGAAAAHEVVVNFTGPALELLVDGVLVDEEWPVGAIAQASGEPLIAAGEIEKFALWNRALRPDEVRDLSGGAEAVARRVREILGPERPVTPSTSNSSTGPVKLTTSSCACSAPMAASGTLSSSGRLLRVFFQSNAASKCSAASFTKSRQPLFRSGVCRARIAPSTGSRSRTRKPNCFPASSASRASAASIRGKVPPGPPRSHASTGCASSAARLGHGHASVSRMASAEIRSGVILESEPRDHLSVGHGAVERVGVGAG